MTAIHAPATAASTGRVARVHLLNWRIAVASPWAIMAASFLINIAIVSTRPAEARVDFTTGGLFSLYGVVLGVNMGFMTQWFPFAMSLGVTRRRYFAASVLRATVQSLAFAVILAALLQLERATDGWGVGLRFFGLPYLVTDQSSTQVLVYGVPLLVVSLGGMFLGVVFQRWRAPGMYVLTLVGILVGGIFLVIAGWRDWWPAIIDWGRDQSQVAVLVGWASVLAAALAALTFLVLRRAAP